MEITESQLSTVLQEALTCFLAFLTHTEKLRESNLPRQGKGIETQADVSIQQQHETRVAATRICVKYTGKIARSVRKWNRHSRNDSDDEISVEPEVVSFKDSLPDGYEMSFLDRYSGPQKYPTSSSPAGTPKKNVDDLFRVSNRSPESPSRHRRRRTRRRECIEVDDERSGEKHRPSIPMTKSIGLHPNVSISLSVLEDEDWSQPTDVRYKFLPKSKARPSISSVYDDKGMNSSIVFQQKLIEREDEVCVEKSTRERQSEEESERRALEVNLLSDQQARTRHRQQEEELDRPAAQEMALLDQQKRIKEKEDELHRRALEAKLLLNQIAQKEQYHMIAQEKYAKKVEQEEREKFEQSRRDREAAKAQQQWEMAAIAQETEAMRLEERERMKQADLKRIAEEQRRLEVKREEAWKSDRRERLRMLAEEKKRKEAENIAAWQREQKELERKEKLAKKVDCVSCMEAGREKNMAVLSCNHRYCRDCIKDAFKSAHKSHSPFKCCGTTIATSSVKRHLSSSFVEKYDLMVLELQTKKPRYCSSSRCNKFIPPAQIHGPVAICPYCKVKTCVACGNNEHSGVCAEDKAGRAVEALAQQEGWKQCPKCSQILERTAGCLHMTCRCKAEWCYSCLRDWSVCRSGCERMTPFAGVAMGPDFRADLDGMGGQEDNGVNRGGIGLAPVIAAAVLFSLFND
ncbi:hypothetical protein VTL71DRAFT_16388 [Oculimacula yallundae]|uniref:RBR-type E3 ubiquitin transferase n=1 Tax=Oculimacula yallundae TaxID=86028 RepID=A0ABR4CEX0_9HELO